MRALNHEIVGVELWVFEIIIAMCITSVFSLLLP